MLKHSGAQDPRHWVNRTSGIADNPVHYSNHHLNREQFSPLQVTIWLTDHSAIGLLLAIQLPNVSDNPMATVVCILAGRFLKVELDPSCLWFYMVYFL